MRYTNPQLVQRLASEYVLGTLAGLALSYGHAAIFSGRKWSSEQASSQPS